MNYYGKRNNHLKILKVLFSPMRELLWHGGYNFIPLRITLAPTPLNPLHNDHVITRFEELYTIPLEYPKCE